MNAQTESRPRPLRWWDLGVLVLVLVLCTPSGLGAVSWDGLGVAPVRTVGAPLAVLAAFVALYVTLGRPALRRGVQEVPRTPLDLGFLTATVALVGVGAGINMSFATLQAIVYPMIWVIVGGGAGPAEYEVPVTRRRGWRAAVAWSAALALAMGLGASVFLVWADTSSPILTAAGVGVASFCFAVVLGTWITSVHEQAERHRALAEELRLAQHEVAELSAVRGAAAERERLSRELHDTLTQTLAGLVMLSEQTERALAAGDAARAAERAGRVSAAARESVAEARALVATTQPLGERGLHASLERIAARLRADTGLEVACQLDEVALDREQQVVLLRAAQEGLANARRHAQATRVALTLEAMPGGGGVLRVTDNGVGPAAGAGVAAPAGAAT
ncbi:sensor histidine kinase, partial [Leucobacter chromiireducens]|uniref:sensor histidine kinase n=1 Tax=Leucobacter chromiireducens TaxID=283877 RepID=UPI000F63A6E5